MKKALYLSGGGARGAYQVGVLKAIQEIMDFKGKIPVDILSCVSAGSINGIMLAMHADNFSIGVKRLEELWLDLKCADVFKVSNWAILKSLIRNIFCFIFSYAAKGYLLDTKPLHALLKTHIDFNRVNHLILSGALDAFEIAANCYDLAETVSFFYSTNPYISWRRVRHVSYRTEIAAEHILASSAIPLFFPAVKVGALHYGDGTMRLTSPLRGALKFGAEKIFIISTRARGASHELVANHSEEVSFAKVLGSMLNALFLDNLDRDLELITRTNEQLVSGKIKSARMRYLETLHIRPSGDLASYTGSCDKNLPVLLRYLLRSFGSRDQSSDFLSFLLFEKEYAKRLIDLGYKDGLAQAADIRAFFSG